jgi:hypothetical protein
MPPITIEAGHRCRCRNTTFDRWASCRSSPRTVSAEGAAANAGPLLQITLSERPAGPPGRALPVVWRDCPMPWPWEHSDRSRQNQTQTMEEFTGSVASVCPPQGMNPLPSPQRVMTPSSPGSLSSLLETPAPTRSPRSCTAEPRLSGERYQRPLSASGLAPIQERTRRAGQRWSGTPYPFHPRLFLPCLGGSPQPDLP